MRNLLKNLVPIFLCVVAALVIGCGGGGGDDGGNPTTGTQTNGNSTNGTSATDIRVEGVLSANQNQVVDLENLQPGDQLQLQLWGRRTTNNEPTVVPSSNWSTNAPSSVLTVSSSGLLQVNGVGSGVYRVTANGGAYSANVTVKSDQAVVKGLVRNTEGVGVPRARIRFYRGDGVQLAEAYTGSNGTFQAAIPTDASGFLVDMTERSATYYNQFGYGQNDFSIICPANKAPLPALTNQSNVSLNPPAIVVTRKSTGQNPPPPPPDCGIGS